SDAAVLALMMLSAVALAYLVARGFSLRFSSVIRALVGESERIGAMLLDTPVAIRAPTREVSTLVAAQERMRVMLLSEVQARDRLLLENQVMNAELRRHRDTLLTEVDSRTAELRREKES